MLLSTGEKYVIKFRRILCNSLFWYIQDIFKEIFGEAGQSGQNWSIDISEDQSVDMSKSQGAELNLSLKFPLLIVNNVI